MEHKGARKIAQISPTEDTWAMAILLIRNSKILRSRNSALYVWVSLPSDSVSSTVTGIDDIDVPTFIHRGWKVDA